MALVMEIMSKSGFWIFFKGGRSVLNILDTLTPASPTIVLVIGSVSKVDFRILYFLQCFNHT